ncbi:MAG: phosphoglucomutase/phosphomannomutase family protein, partial [Candidatus Methylomirabilales bacterium]
MVRIRFGTSGWRGVIADDFTFDGVRAVALAIAEYVRGEGGKDLVIGYDTRFASSAVAALVARVLAAQGVKALLAKRDTPTP